MIKTDVFHDVVTLGVGHCIIGFAQVPLAGEVGVVATGFQHGGQGPFRCRQATALALEGHGGHAASVGNAPGLHGRPTRRATGLGIEREEGCALRRQFVDARRRHAATHTAAIGAQVTVAGIVGYDKKDVWFFCLRCLGKVNCHQEGTC
ncbi:hypothetical protein D3C71_1404900 [compost metagenome]